MTASSAARVLDPLGAQDAVPSELSVPVAVAPRRERVAPRREQVAPRGDRAAPDVTGTQGVEAVRVVRAGGFIAAIEPVRSGLAQEGTVIEQDPPPGTLLEREAVVTLRLAAPCEASESAEQNDGAPASELGERAKRQDDTEEWFAALAGTGHGNRNEGVPGRRRRKHRYPRPAVSELVFDAPPAPRPVQARLARAIPPLERKGSDTGVWLRLRVTVGVAAAWLASLPWRRTSAVAVGLLLCAAIGMWAFGSSDRRSQAVNHRALASTAPRKVAAQTKVVRGPRRPRSVAHPQGKRAIGHPRLRTIGSVQAPREVHARIAAVGTPRSPTAQVVVVPAKADPPPIAGQFAYLGQ
jgi:hypothetical protein